MKHNCKLPRRISNLIVCSAALLGLAIPWPAQSSGEASVGARTFVDEFIELAEVHDIFATGLQWDRVKAWARQSAASGRADSLSGYPIVAEALKSAGDFHGALNPTNANTKLYKQRFGKLWAEPTARHPNSDFLDRADIASSDVTLGNGANVRLFNVPEVHTWNDEQAYASKLLDVIMSAPQKTCGFILDLRGNMGGDMGPMLAGVSPLLGRGIVGGYTDKVKPPSHWRVDFGRSGEINSSGFYQDDFAIRGVKRERRRALVELPVAVVTDDGVLSSGEVVAIAFRRRPHTRSFGTKTYGFTTSNAAYPLSDGSQIYLASGFAMDRTGRLYRNGVPPDVKVDSSGSAAATAVIRAARGWLSRQNSCGREARWNRRSQAVGFQPQLEHVPARTAYGRNQS